MLADQHTNTLTKHTYPRNTRKKQTRNNFPGTLHNLSALDMGAAMIATGCPVLVDMLVQHTTHQGQSLPAVVLHSTLGTLCNVLHHVPHGLPEAYREPATTASLRCAAYAQDVKVQAAAVGLLLCMARGVDKSTLQHVLAAVVGLGTLMQCLGSDTTL